MSKAASRRIGTIVGLIVVLGGGYYVVAGYFGAETYDKSTLSHSTSSAEIASTPGAPEPLRVTHLPTPKPVRAIYMTSWVAGVPTWRAKILKFIDDTEINALVIDVKDYTGVFVTERAPDVEDFIRELHAHNIYVIGRVSAFQDQAYVTSHPELAVRRKDNGGVWGDRKGIHWLDAGSHEAWDYIAKVSRDAYALGFDEINLDYIRFPSDGDMQNASYPASLKLRRASTTADLDKASVLKSFYQYITNDLHKDNIIVSADLFGMTTTAIDDMGIGQVLENALPFFDYVAPMVYPSHFPPQFNGWANPNKVPGEIIAFSMGEAVKRARILDGFSSTTPAGTYSPTAAKLRPWLQDFDYGGQYGEPEVRAQKSATYSVGLDSWMMWDPGVKYTPSAYNNASTSEAI